MKVLFKQKQWIVIQAIFVIISIIAGISIKAHTKEPVGGLAMGLHFIASTTEYGIPIFFILFSDLLFNVEYLQGTFLTHLTCGQSRRVWMLKKSITFYMFILLQILITLVLISLVTGALLGHFGLQGLKELDKTVYNMKTTELVRGIGLNTLRIFMFVSFAVFVSTLLPGKLVIGSIASIGAIFIIMRIMADLYHTYKDSKVMDFVVRNFFFENPTKLAWVFGILWVLIFTWLSIERVNRVEIASRGA
ncbi:MAG: hypothetical protein K6343_02365 [Caldisericaceae bacterium]